MGNFKEIVNHFQDSEESVYSAELHLLRVVAQTANLRLEAQKWDELRNSHPEGQGFFDKEHEEAVKDYQEWLHKGIDCFG